jgi:transposase
MDMSAAYAKGAALALPQAQISYDLFHVIAMAHEAMDQVRRVEMAQEAPAVRAALGAGDRKTLKQLRWGIRRNPSGWSMHWLQRSALKSARAWRLKMALREVYAQARSHNSHAQAAIGLGAWLRWARRCRLEPFKKLASTLKERFDAVVRGMVDHRSNAIMEALNGLLQRAKRAARGFRTSANFIAIAYLRMSKLKHLPTSPFAPATAK